MQVELQTQEADLALKALDLMTRTEGLKAAGPCLALANKLQTAFAESEEQKTEVPKKEK